MLQAWHAVMDGHKNVNVNVGIPFFFEDGQQQTFVAHSWSNPTIIPWYVLYTISQYFLKIFFLAIQPVPPFARTWSGPIGMRPITIGFIPICPLIWAIWLPAALDGMPPFIIMPPYCPGFPCCPNCCWGYELVKKSDKQEKGWSCERERKLPLSLSSP